jgi:hypothetical protein
MKDLKSRPQSEVQKVVRRGAKGCQRSLKHGNECKYTVSTKLDPKRLQEKIRENHHLLVTVGFY